MKAFHHYLTCMSTFVWFVPCMCPDMLLKVGELCELSLANLASIGLDAKMNPHVLREVGAVGK